MSIPSIAPVAADPLAERFRQLRADRSRPEWPQLLFEVGRELTMASAGALVAGEPPARIAPDAQADLPEAWVGAARRAMLARGVWAGQFGNGWLFAVPVGVAGPFDRPGPPAVLVIEIGASQQMDLALTRERLVTLAAHCETITQAAAGAIAIRSAMAAAAVEAMLRAPDRAAALAEAAKVLAHGVAGIERLALGRLSGKRVGALAVADQPSLDRSADLSRLLAGMIEEALDDPNGEVLGETRTRPAQKAYIARFGARPIFAMHGPARSLGLAVALTEGHSPNDTAIQLAPALALLERVLEPLPPRVAMWTRRRWLLRAAVPAGLLAILAVWPRVDRVEAPASFQPEWQQVVSAPFDGIVARSTVQPGDAVEADATVLARLETREIELEIASARARAANERRDATIARAAGQPAQEQLALLAATRAESQLALLENRLTAAELRSPRSGVVVSGDLRRSLGQPVLRGQTLFEVAPPDATRADLRVLDEDVTRVARGQKVWILPAAEPDRPRQGIVERVRPMAELVQSRNAFLVTVELEPDSQPLRPGSEGIAHVEVGKTTWLWTLFRQPVRHLRRLLWI